MVLLEISQEWAPLPTFLAISPIIFYDGNGFIYKNETASHSKMPTPLPWDEVNMLGSKKLESIESNESLDTACLNNFIYQSTNFHVPRFPWIYLMLSKYVNHKRVLKDIHKQLVKWRNGQLRPFHHPVLMTRNYPGLGGLQSSPTGIKVHKVGWELISLMLMSHDRHHRKFIPADYSQAIKYYRTGEQPMWPSSDEKREKPSFFIMKHAHYYYYHYQFLLLEPYLS